ncbi:hypothetical protein ACLMYS_003820 [Salmonella enterica]|nr:hypothetical protein [Salmonella enterica subsp. enterica serovar Typhimurium]
MSLFNLARDYAIGMVGTGIVAAVVDYSLFTMGAITRKISFRGCLIMGLFWPLFIILLVHLAWKHCK